MLYCSCHAYQNRFLYFPADEGCATGNFSLDEAAASRRLSAVINICTIFSDSHTDTGLNEFLRFHAYLEKAFPLLHKKLKKEVVNNYSLLYPWPGRNASLKPIILLAHLDVVPVEEKSRGAWKYKPFEGHIAEGYIWGRGVLDNKGNLLGITEAIEGLLT